MKKRYSIALFCAMVGLSACKQSDDSGASVGWVDIPTVIQQSGVGKQEEERKAALLKEIQQASEKAQSIYKSMKKDEAEKYAAKDREMLNRLWVNRQAQLRAMTLKAVQEQTEMVRKELGYSVIVNSEQVVAATKQVDITASVLLKMKDMKVDYGEDPSLEIEKPVVDSQPPEKAASGNADTKNAVGNGE